MLLLINTSERIIPLLVKYFHQPSGDSGLSHSEQCIDNRKPSCWCATKRTDRIPYIRCRILPPAAHGDGSSSPRQEDRLSGCSSGIPRPPTATSTRTSVMEFANTGTVTSRNHTSLPIPMFYQADVYYPSALDKPGMMLSLKNIENSRLADDVPSSGYTCCDMSLPNRPALPKPNLDLSPCLVLPPTTSRVHHPFHPRHYPRWRQSCQLPFEYHLNPAIDKNHPGVVQVIIVCMFGWPSHQQMVLPAAAVQLWNDADNTSSSADMP